MSAIDTKMKNNSATSEADHAAAAPTTHPAAAAATKATTKHTAPTQAVGSSLRKPLTASSKTGVSSARVHAAAASKTNGTMKPVNNGRMHVMPSGSTNKMNSTASSSHARVNAASMAGRTRPAPQSHTSTPVIHRTITFGSGGSSASSSSSGTAGVSESTSAITLSVVEVDITLASVDAIINAANNLSFRPMDGGVSGALRRACEPADVCNQPKRYWTSDGAEHQSIRLDTTQAGVQPAAGRLLQRGVRHIIHAVGPMWTDHPIKGGEKMFRIVCDKIRLTIHRALSAARMVGARSCALPAISGGIFCHWKEGSDIHDREQAAARRAAIQAVAEWADQHATKEENTLKEIHLCDLDPRHKGAIHLFIEEFDQFLEARRDTVPVSMMTATASAAADVSTVSESDSEGLEIDLAGLSLTAAGPAAAAAAGPSSTAHEVK